MADSKVADLTQSTTPVGSDIVYVVVDPGGTPLNRKVQLVKLLRALTTFAAAGGTETLTYTTGSVSVGNLKALAAFTAELTSQTGGLAIGQVDAEGGDTLIDAGAGGFAGGSARTASTGGATTAYAYIAAGSGSIAIGVALATDNDSFSEVACSTSGGIVHGMALSDTAGSAILEAIGRAGSAGGVAIAEDAGTGKIKASDDGAFANGNASARGGFDATLEASGRAAAAIGDVTTVAAAAQITASGDGSLAFGVVTDGDIVASGTNCGQFGVGTNAQNDSFSVGNAVRLNGVAGTAPGTPRDGDIWVDGSGNVIIRSNGADITIA